VVLAGSGRAAERGRALAVVAQLVEHFTRNSGQSLVRVWQRWTKALFKAFDWASAGGVGQATCPQPARSGSASALGFRDRIGLKICLA